MSGMFRPGEPVTLRGVAQALGTSIMPVREAVRRLVSERALEMPSARSIRAPAMSRQKFDELCAMRILLEGEAAALAAGEVTPEEIDELERINRRIEASVKAGDVKGMLAANQEFHYALYGAARQELLLALIETLWLQGGSYLNLLINAAHGEALKVDFSRHLDLIDALRRRSPRAARDALRADILEASEIYRAKIDRASVAAA
jgi:DNA-binding GntR family transcriptional regulator